MKRYGLILAISAALLLAGTAEAAELNLEIVFSSPRAETTRLTLAYEGLFPTYSQEVPAGATSVPIGPMTLEPAFYELYISVASQETVRRFGFTLAADGTVVFDPAEGMAQDGNRILISDMP